MTSIELIGVHKAFPLAGGSSGGTKLALHDVTLSVHAGTRLGVIGPNGAGKSTLLHVIAGTTWPTSGAVSVQGKVTSILTLGVGLREDYTGRENVYLDGEVHGKPRKEIDGLIDDVISFSELDEFIDLPVRTYSTGMKSRLMFAMVSYLEPEILLIDEALSAGDYAFSRKATRRIRDICARGKIVIVVSHGLAAINEMCDRCLWLDGGRVVMDGPASEVTAAYQKAVSEADDIDVLKEFHAHAGPESFVVGYEITDLKWRHKGESRARQLLRTGAACELVIECDTPRRTAGADVLVAIERVDGLLLLEERLSQALGGRLTSGRECITIGLDPLTLGWGTYRVTAELIVAGATAARHSTIFEVQTANPAAGGRPAVVYPYQVACQQHD